MSADAETAAVLLTVVVLLRLVIYSIDNFTYVYLAQPVEDDQLMRPNAELISLVNRTQLKLTYHTLHVCKLAIIRLLMITKLLKQLC